MAKDYSSIHRKLVTKYFWQVIKNYKVSFFVLLGLVVLTSFIDIYIPIKYLKLWEVLSTNSDNSYIEARNLILLILGIISFRFIARRASSFLNDYFQAEVMAGLRKQAFSYMIGHSHEFFASKFGGSLVQKINKYARAFEKLMEKLVSDGLPLIVRGLGTIVAIYVLLPKYSYILFIFCFIFVMTAFIVTRYKLKYDIIAAHADTKTTGALADSIGNHSSVQLFTGHKYEEERVGGVIDDQKKAVVFNWYLWDGLNAIQSFYAVVIEFLIMWIAIGDWKVGLISLPLIVLLQSYVIRLVENLWNFAGIVRTFYDGFADAQEMAVILDKPYSVLDTPKEELISVKGALEFKGVTYIYDRNNTKVFDNFSLTIPAGQKVAIIGSSGAGKSTFVKLIMRLFDVTSGNISIDGVDIRNISQENLRENISFVPQEPILFHRTLMENIRYGRRDATDEEVKRAAELAHCTEFIENLPYKYDTYVGERGVKLSGGERQRVAIARAILKDAPILVLDEATSSLDSQSEVLIQDALHNLIKGKTTIVIAHRLSTIREMDRIVVIANGQIVEEGTHEELIKKEEGEYKKLWDLQAGGFKPSLG